MLRIITTKTIMSRVQAGEDSIFGLRYNMNLYRGCQHACIYCDSRSMCYQLGDLSDIREKENALEILEDEINRKRIVGTIGTGSMNDPYMPVEKKRELVRGALKIISRYRFPVHIMTKSDLVVRDLDILKEISKIYVAVSFTITAIDDELSKTIEPCAPISSDRFTAMKTLSEAGIYTGVIMSPILPWITDSKENIEGIFKKAKDCGAKYIISWLETTQRTGQREYFYKKLDKSFPGTRKKYEKRFGEEYICSPENYDELKREFKRLSKEYDIPVKMEFYTPLKFEQPKLFN